METSAFNLTMKAIDMNFTGVTDFFAYENKSIFRFVVEKNGNVKGLTIQNSLLQKVK